MRTESGAPTGEGEAEGEVEGEAGEEEEEQRDEGAPTEREGKVRPLPLFSHPAPPLVSP